MGTDVDVLLRTLARELKPRAAQLVDALIERFRIEQPESWKYPDVAALAPLSTMENVTDFLDALDHGLDVTKAEAAESTLQLARHLARHGLPITELLRAFRLGHAGTIHVLQEEAARITKDPELLQAAAIVMGAMGFDYVDRTSEQAVVAYQAERDRWLQRRLILVNEASRLIGTTLDVSRTAEELAQLGASDFADLVVVDLLDSVFTDHDAQPNTAELKLHRIAERSASPNTTDPSTDSARPRTYPVGSAPERALAAGQPARYRIDPDRRPDWLARPAAPAGHGVEARSALLVPLRARGNPLGIAQFVRYRSSDPFDDDDLLLAQEIASRAAVCIDNARRYTHEHSTALTLQRSLLQQSVPEQSAVQAASRYLPSGSQAGIGGDWYDVVPLSGARVALVVGDVVGRGLTSSATMGRLRTAVRTLADIDLTPEELLTHLDDVVIRLQREEAQDADGISATCLYAIYDPVTRMCSLASAGHMLPAVVRPRTAKGGSSAITVSFPDMPVGPPLGLGGLPFEAAQFEVPEGTLLALFTDGLIENRERDLDDGVELLREALTDPPDSLEELCDQVLEALGPTFPEDDVALLIARTQALHADHVASWALPSDPAIVSTARTSVGDQLIAWGLEEMSFTTELLVSELVTNAIRYGQPPIQLRMILDSALTCEVSDTSSTAPHLRRARMFDEGGRGLLLVAQLTDRWGARHNREGKIIWAEQPLPVP